MPRHKLLFHSGLLLLLCSLGVAVTHAETALTNQLVQHPSPYLA